MPTFGWVTKRETVTVAVFFMKPTLVTRPVNAMGGMVARRAGEEEDEEGKEEEDASSPPPQPATERLKKLT